MITLLGIFDSPPDWTKGTIYCIGQKSDKWSKPDRYTIDDVPEPHKATLAAIVSGFTQLSDDWYCSQFWAASGKYLVTKEVPDAENPGNTIRETEYAPCVNIRMECKHKVSGALRTITPEDNISLRLTDAASLALYSALCDD